MAKKGGKIRKNKNILKYYSLDAQWISDTF